MLPGKPQRLASDLFNIEINTIVKPQISSGSMPQIRFALCDIANRYLLTLKSYDEVAPQVHEYEATVYDDSGSVYGGFSTFGIIESVAKTAQIDLEEKPGEMSEDEQTRYYMLQRIRTNATRLKSILKSGTQVNSDSGLSNNKDNHYTKKQLAKFVEEENFEDLPVHEAQYSTIRKIWELGTETIAMQTIVQLDGDIFTRVQSKFAHPEFQALHSLHAQSFDLGVKHWSSIIEIVTGFFETLFSGMFKRGK